MDYYKKRQEEGFQQLKDLLEEKKTSDMVQKYVERLENVFLEYVITDLNWDTILTSVRALDGDKLENHLFSLALLAESYKE